MFGVACLKNDLALLVARAKALQTIAMKKFATPSDIASTVVFLCSANAGHITGQALTVSGGMEGRKLYDDDDLAM